MTAQAQPNSSILPWLVGRATAFSSSVLQDKAASQGKQTAPQICPASTKSLQYTVQGRGAAVRGQQLREG